MKDLQDEIAAERAQAAARLAAVEAELRAEREDGGTRSAALKEECERAHEAAAAARTLPLGRRPEPYP